MFHRPCWLNGVEWKVGFRVSDERNHEPVMGRRSVGLERLLWLREVFFMVFRPVPPANLGDTLSLWFSSSDPSTV